MSKTLPLHAALRILLPLLLVLAWPAHGQGRAESAPAKAKPRAEAKKPAARKAPSAVQPATAAMAPKATASAAAPADRPAPASASAREADYIVAVVNTEPITNNEVRARAARAEREMTARGMVPPPAATLRNEMLERLIGERAQLQYAREIGLKVDGATLEQAELSIARQNRLGSVEDLHRRVEAEGISVKDFQDDVRNQVLLARLREREIEPKLRVTDTEVDAFIREQTGASTGTPEINLAMILVAVPDGSGADELARLKARADDVARRARAGEDFAKLAQEFSDANNRGRDGGVLGLRPLDRYPDLFVRSTQGAPVGGIVGPVKSDAGFHVLKVIERKVNRDLPEVRIPIAQVRQIVLRIGPTQSAQVARDRLADFKRRIQSRQASFGELAREFSQDPSAREGGDLGWVPPGQFVPEIERVVGNLDPGQISDPVASGDGVYLMQVEGRREQVLTSDQQRQMARNMLREKKAEEAFDTWAREVRGRAYIEYREPPK